MKQYRWIKIKDVRGDTYEFEDCKVCSLPGQIIIFFTAPIGTVRKVFYKRNLVSFEYLAEFNTPDLV